MDSPRHVAHDLNNIVFVISGYAQRLEEAMGKDDPLQQDVQAILAEIPRLTALGDRIRSFVAPAAPAPLASSSGSQQAPSSEEQQRILLVEDEPAVRELLRQALERRGYAVQTGASGEEGLALCDAIEPPDLLIADLILPGATGPVIAQRMRERAPDVKVLLISGYAEHPLLEAAHAAGESCLVKPFEMASFNDTVARLLDARAAHTSPRGPKPALHVPACNPGRSALAP